MCCSNLPSRLCQVEQGGGAGTVNESKDIRQIALPDTVCLCGKGAAGALASGSFNHGTSTHGVSGCNVQFVSDNGHVLQSGQSELRVPDSPVHQKGGCFVEAPGSAAVSCLGFSFLPLSGRPIITSPNGFSEHRSQRFRSAA